MDMFEVKVDPLKWFEFARRHGERRPSVGKAVAKAKQKKAKISFWKTRVVDSK